MSRVKLMGLMFVGCVLLAGQVAQAGFIGGVETFDGTTKDLVTWEQYTNDGTISQDDQLTIVAGGKGDFTTNTVQVGVGEAVYAYLDQNSTNTYGSAAILLTTNSLGESGRATDDSYNIGVHWNNSAGSPKVFARVADNVSVPATETDASIATGMSDMNGWFQIERLSSTQARFSAFNSDKSPLGTSQTMTFSDVPDDLYIALFTQNAIFNRDNVTLGTITPTPEPSVIIMALTGLVGLLAYAWRKRK